MSFTRRIFVGAASLILVLFMSASTSTSNPSENPRGLTRGAESSKQNIPVALAGTGFRTGSSPPVAVTSKLEPDAEFGHAAARVYAPSPELDSMPVVEARQPTAPIGRVAMSWDPPPRHPTRNQVRLRSQRLLLHETGVELIDRVNASKRA